MSEISLYEHRPEITENVIHHHDLYYRTNWGFDERFTAQVTSELGDFIESLDPERDGFWWAAKDGEFVGAIAVDGTTTPDEARLRWFIVPEEFQGDGIGAMLFDKALQFCRERDFTMVFLWTFKGLNAARKLYERNGFIMVAEVDFKGWGPEIMAQRFVLNL